MNVLFVKYSGGGMATHCHRDEDYTDAETVATGCRDDCYPGETYLHVQADHVAVETFMQANSKEANDFNISQKQNVPGGDTMFFKTGETAGDLSDTDLVLHCTP